MNKSYSSILSSIAVAALFLTGCGNDSDSSAGSSTKTGIPGSVAGSEIVINPLIKFNADGLNFEYDNLEESSKFPTGLINGTFTTSENDGTGELTLTLSSTGFTDDLVLVLSGFLDDGSDGLIDTFSFEATYGGIETTGSGQFIGGKPANPDVDPASIPDVSGAPTIDEWNKHIVGKNMVWIDDEVHYVDVVDSKKYVSVDEDGFTYYGTYTYEKTGDNTGIITARDESVGTNGQYWEMEATVTFEDFFSATFQETKDLDILPDGTEVENNLDTGQFRIFTDVSFLSD